MPSTGRSAAATPRTRPMRFRPVRIDISASSLSVTVDFDVRGIVEGCGAAIVDCVVEVPTGRGELPDELVELVSVFLVPKPSAFGGEVVLVPPLILRPREQRIPARRLAADEVSAHRH